MRSFNYEYSPTLHGPVSKNEGSCLQISKTSKVFRYYIINDYIKCITGLNREETLQFTIEMVNSFIKEFELDIEFGYDNGWFDFRYSIDKNIYNNNELYCCVILSRYMVSGSTTYDKILNYMYELINKGYTVFESYIIASSSGDVGSYSFTNGMIVDLSDYKSIKDKKSIINNSSKINNTIPIILKSRIGVVPTLLSNPIAIEKHYFEILEKTKNVHNLFMKVEPQALDEESKLYETSSSSNMYLDYIKAIKRLAECEFIELAKDIRVCDDMYIFAILGKISSIANAILVGSYGVYVCNKMSRAFKIVHNHEFLKYQKDLIINNMTEGRSLNDTEYGRKLIEIYRKKGLNLTDEINASGILEKELTR